MATQKKVQSQIQLAALVALVLFMASLNPTVMSAQGISGGNANGSQVGAVKSQDQDQDQSRKQDPVSSTSTDRDQVREQKQDQDMIHVPVNDGAVSQQNQDQDRNRTQDQSGVIYDDHEQIQLRDQDRVQNQVSNSQELREVITQTRNQIQTEAQALGSSQRNIYQNQNQVRVAAAALASSSNLLGSLGPAINRIANSYQESIPATMQAEERIQTRSRINSFLYGGDQDAAAELDQRIRDRKEQTESLVRLLDVWEGDPEVKKVLQEQVQTLEQEQVRLQKLVDDEQSSRGLFSYLFFWRN